VTRYHPAGRPETRAAVVPELPATSVASFFTLAKRVTGEAP
jgi:hypothetical protein